MSPMTMAIALDFLCQEQRLSFSIRVDCGMLRILRWEKRPASMLMRGVLLDATLDLPVQGDGQLSVGLPIRHDNEVNLDEPLPPDQEVVRNDANPAEQQLPVMKQKPATIDPASMCYSSSTSDSRSRLDKQQEARDEAIVRRPRPARNRQPLVLYRESEMHLH